MLLILLHECGLIGGQDSGFDALDPDGLPDCKGGLAVIPGHYYRLDSEGSEFGNRLATVLGNHIGYREHRGVGSGGCHEHSLALCLKPSHRIANMLIERPTFLDPRKAADSAPAVSNASHNTLSANCLEGHWFGRLEAGLQRR